MVIPLSYNIAHGVIAGVVSYVIINGVALIIRKSSGGRILTHEWDRSEKWVMPVGGFVPLWMRRLARGDKKFWVDDTAHDVKAPESDHASEHDVKEPVEPEKKPIEV
jgi:adenine/guanine/hypoxanthine permease